MSKRKQKKSSLKPLLLLLLLTAVLLIIATYAWFTANPNVSVKAMNVHVDAQNGLEISTDGSNWKAMVTTDEILAENGATTSYPGAVNQIPEVLNPVSTVGELNAVNGYLKMFKVDVQPDETSGQYMLTASSDLEQNVNDTQGNFIAFDLFFKVDQGEEVVLDGASGAGVTYNGVGSSKGVENYSRVAFVVEGNRPNGTSLATIQGLKEATASDVYIWEPNADTHTTTGVAAAYDSYGIGGLTAGTGNATLSYSGIKAPILSTNKLPLNQNPLPPDGTGTFDSAAWTAYLAAVTTIPTPASYAGTTQTIFTLQSGITKVRVYCWLEGQDADCENSASGQDILFNLAFVSGSSLVP